MVLFWAGEFYPGHTHREWREGEVRQVEPGLQFWGLLPRGKWETAKRANGGTMSICKLCQLEPWPVWLQIYIPICSSAASVFFNSKWISMRWVHMHSHTQASSLRIFLSLKNNNTAVTVKWSNSPGYFGSLCLGMVSINCY